MSIDFHSMEQVTIKQLVDAGVRCGIEITKNTLSKDTYTMTWDVDDYAEYAERLDKKTMRVFCEKIKPRGERFVMERDFVLSEGYFMYEYDTNCDDAGIAHRLFDEVTDVTLITLDEYHQSTFEEHEKITRDDMGQDDVVAEIEAESYDDTVDDSHDTDGYGGRLCVWCRTGFPLERSAMEQDEVALSVEVGNDE